MNLIKILAIAVALAMDAFTVAVATGVSLKCVSIRQTFRLAWHFGLFQFLMPIIGWNLGEQALTLIEHYDHWVAFGLLVFVGGHLIKEALQPEEERKPQKDPTRGMTLVMLSVATSIDALAVGFSMAMLKVAIVFPAIIIGIVACAFTIVGLHLGKSVGSWVRISHYAEITGGIVLFLIALNILREHGVFAFLGLSS